MRRSLIISTAAILTALALSGCTAGSTSNDSAVSPGDSGGVGAPQEGTEEGFRPQNGGEIASDAAISTGREVITTGYVTITVESPQDAATEAIRIVEAAGGRIDGRSEYAPRGGGGDGGGSASLTLRVPSDDLTKTLEALRELGDVQEVALNSSDVTMESRDLDARISALSASVDRLLALLANASDTDTLIQLETAISDRQAQLESLESQRRYLSEQVSLSTIQLNLVTEQVVPDAQPGDFFSGIVTGWNAFLAFFSGLIVVLGVLVPWLVFGAIVTGIILLIVRLRRRTAVPSEAAVSSPKKVSSSE
ncbi:MAG: DUF4349 domain-containing protein [Salinibacterium sp.]|nr:DUF4349 domain-containing protein [Salinibacterium sp.]